MSYEVRKDEISWENITGTCQGLAESRRKFDTIITLQKCINLFCEILLCSKTKL